MLLTMIMMKMSMKGKANEETKIRIRVNDGKTIKKETFIVESGKSQEKSKAITILYVLQKMAKGETDIITKDKWMLEWLGGKIQEKEDVACLNVKEKMHGNKC